MTQYIRFNSDFNENTSLCPHIILLCVTERDDGNCEYTSEIKIFCNICNESFKFTECIN